MGFDADFANYDRAVTAADGVDEVIRVQQQLAEVVRNNLDTSPLNTLHDQIINAKYAAEDMIQTAPVQNLHHNLARAFIAIEQATLAISDAEEELEYLNEPHKWHDAIDEMIGG